MKALIIGSGGREHALAWKVAQSSRVDSVFVAPGNAGTAVDSKLENIPIGATDIDDLIDFTKEKGIELTIVGPEAPLVAGITDAFKQAGLRCFGPSKGAAQLEGSKAFCKDFLWRHNIPTAGYQTFSELEPAKAYIRERGMPIVIKADGLAAGKGVIIAQSEPEAFSAVEGMLSGSAFGEAGRRVVVEDLLVGEEASFIVMVDGKHILPLATSQDHKARDDGDRGPNTGGMGAYSPAPVVTPQIYDRIMKEVIERTVKGMEADGYPYTGFLYAGLMISDDGTPRVLEYNCRFGDPETQPILLRLRSDLSELCMAALAKGWTACMQNGTSGPHWVLSWQRADIQQAIGKGMRFPDCLSMRRRDQRFFMPRPRCKTAAWLPTVAGCFVRRLWGLLSARPRNLPTS